MVFTLLSSSYGTHCKPPLKDVYVAFERKVSWHGAFTDSHTRKRLCTLVFHDEVKLYEMAKRGGALTNLEAKQAIELAIAKGSHLFGKPTLYLRQ